MCDRVTSRRVSLREYDVRRRPDANEESSSWSWRNHPLPSRQRGAEWEERRRAPSTRSFLVVAQWTSEGSNRGPSIGTTKRLLLSRESRKRGQQSTTTTTPGWDFAGFRGWIRRAGSVFVRDARTVRTQVHTYIHARRGGKSIPPTDRPTDRLTDDGVATRRRDATSSSPSSSVSIHPPPAWLPRRRRRRGRRDRDKRSAGRSARDWVRAGQESDAFAPAASVYWSRPEGISNKAF